MHFLLPASSVPAFASGDAIQRLLPPNAKANVLRRMYQRYSSRVSLALQLEAKQAKQAIEDAYHDAEALPSTTTDLRLKVAGLLLDGPLHEGSKLTIGFKGFGVYVVKPLDDSEARGLEPWLKVVETYGSHPHIIEFELSTASRGKSFMIMPQMATMLEPIPLVSGNLVAQLWSDLSSALQYLHDHGLVHADVKPSNIGVTASKSLVLIDLGSLSSIGPHRPSTTLAYLPRDVEHRASAALDWWMLGMTMAEKCPGSLGTGLVIGEGPSTSNVSMKDLVARLSQQLPGEVFQQWRAKLPPI